MPWRGIRSGIVVILRYQLESIGSSVESVLARDSFRCRIRWVGGGGSRLKSGGFDLVLLRPNIPGLALHLPWEFHAGGKGPEEWTGVHKVRNLLACLRLELGMIGNGIGTR